LFLSYLASKVLSIKTDKCCRIKLVRKVYKNVKIISTWFLSVGENNRNFLKRRVGKQTDKQTNRQTDKQTNRQTDKQTNRQTDKQTNRQTDKQTDKQTNKQSTK
jgi:hypothetical protein